MVGNVSAVETLPDEINAWLDWGIEAEFGQGDCEDDGQTCTTASVETTVHDKIYNVTLCLETKDE